MFNLTLCAILGLILTIQNSAPLVSADVTLVDAMYEDAQPNPVVATENDGYGDCPALYHSHGDGQCYDNDDNLMRDRSKALPVPGTTIMVEPDPPTLPELPDGWY